MKKPVEKEYLKQQFKNFFTEILDKNYLRKSDYNPGGSSAEVEELTYDETMAILNGDNINPDDEPPTIETPPDPYDIAPAAAHNNWNYVLDDENDTITFNCYTGSETDVIVYANYEVDGKVYKTQIVSNTEDADYNSKYMFNGYIQKNCREIQSIKFSKNIETKNIENMSYMFNCCYALTSLDISNFDTKKVTKMAVMFQYCRSIVDLDLGSFETANVEDMSFMFGHCEKLNNIYVTEGKWITSKANTNNMFASCGTSSVTYK